MSTVIMVFLYKIKSWKEALDTKYKKFKTLTSKYTPVVKIKSSSNLEGVELITLIKNLFKYLCYFNYSRLRFNRTYKFI